MRFWRIGIVLGLWCGLAAVPVGSVAQDRCESTGDIVTLARTILEDRDTLTRLARRQFGTEAAYMMLHYYGMDDSDATDLMAQLMTEPIRDLDELNATMLMSRFGIDAGLQAIDPDPVRAFAMAGRSVRRALLLADNGQSYFDLLRRAIDTPAFDPRLPPQTVAGIDLIAYVSNQPDDVLLTIAQTAEAAGFIASAVVLAADMTTLDAYQAIIDRHRDDPALTAQAPYSWVTQTGATLRHDTGPVPRMDAAAQAERGATDMQTYTILRAMFHDGPMQFSGVLMNQTGWIAEGEQVAAAFLAEVEAGRIDPLRDPETAWLFQYRAWAALKGRDAVHSVLSNVDFPLQRIRHFAGTALTSLDWMVAKEALRRFVQTETTTLPTRPALLSDGFDWDLWITAAQAITTGDRDALSVGGPDMLAIAAELLADIGVIDDAMVIAPDAFDDVGRLTFLRDVMLRLDRHCDAITAQPGEAMLLGGTYLFRF